MRKFALIGIDEINGRIKFFKLAIDGECPFDQFEEEIEKEGNYKSELRTIETRMHEIANNHLLPKTKFRDITPKNEVNKEYEIKTRHLRVYIFLDKTNGQIIITGGKKGSQKRDINSFRQIKREYFKSKQSC